MTLDPTRTTTKQNEAAREWRVRWADAKHAVLDYIEALPRKRKEASVITRLFSNAPAKYIFDIAPEGLETIQVAIADILADKVAGDWLFDEYVARAYAQGAAQAQATLWPQFKALGITESPLPFSAVEAYQHRMTLLQARIFEEVAWIAKEQAQSVGKILSRAILQGEGAIDTGKLISQLFDKREYIGERLARTEITMALKRARLDEGEAQAELHGLEVKFMWTSAFSPTSRLNHMLRHGKLYTAEEIREFYSRSGEAINCKCSHVEIILNRKGEPLAKGLISRAEKIKLKYSDRIEEAKNAA